MNLLSLHKNYRQMHKDYLKLLLFPLCISVFCSLEAQKNYQLSGSVVDQMSGENLIGASVFVKNTTVGAITNQYGFYSLSLSAGYYTVEVSYLGYVTKEIEVNMNENQTLNVKLLEDAAMIEEVVVSADRLGDKARSPQIGVEKMSSKTVNKLPVVLGESDILKSIQLLPGITDGGEGTGGMYIRGGSSDQNLVLLDGSTVYNSSHLFGFFSTFNTDAINDIQVFKGGIPPQYGGRLSGVLDVMQREGNNRTYGINGGIGSVSSRLLVEGPIKKDKGSFLIAGRRSYADVFLRLAGETNVLYFYDVNLKANYRINDKHHLFVSGFLGRDVLGFDEFGLETVWGNTGLNVRWNMLITPKLFANANYNLSDYLFEFGFPGFVWRSRILTHNLKYDLSYYANNFRVKAGVDGKYYEFVPGELDGGDVSLDNKYAGVLDFYLGVEQDITPRLSVNYGCRLSSFYRLGGQNIPYYENDMPVRYFHEQGVHISQKPIGFNEYASRSDVVESFVHAEPRLSGIYRLSDRSSFKLGYNRMVQYLHLVSNTSAPAPYDTWIPSGTYFEPMISDQISVGYFQNLKNNSYEFSVEAFYKLIDNMVDYIDGADLMGNNFVETEILSGEARAYGLEVYFKKNVGKLTGWLSYTLSRTERRVPGVEEGDPGINGGAYYPSTYDRPHDLSVTGMYEHSKKWTFGANFIYQTGRPTTYMKGYYIMNNTFIPHYESRNSERMPAYHRMDLSATMRPHKNAGRRLQIDYVFNIYNVYHRKNAASISFDFDAETKKVVTQKTWIFGIVPSLTVNFKW